MHMLLLFGILTVHHPEYKAAFDLTTNAVYEGSDVKTYVNEIEDRVKKQYPQLTTAGALGYTVFVKKQVKFTSRRVALPGSTMTYAYDHNNKSGSVSINWSW